MREQLYAVEYRNMRTSVHGLFVYEDLEVACEVDERLAEVSDDQCVVTLEEETMFSDMRTDAMADVDYEEIDYRAVDWDDEIGESVYRDAHDDDDDLPIIVVNTDHVVWDIYGL